MNLFSAASSTRKKLRIQKCMACIFGGMSVLILVPLFLLIAYLTYKAWPALTWEFIFGLPKKGMRAGGIWPAVVGTLYLVFFSLVLSAPVGVLAGVYMNEYARDNWFTRIVNLAVLNLAGVPSIVYALFGVGAFVIFFDFGKNIISASLTIAIMTLPAYVVATKEALNSVPRSFRVACWNLGATKWQTIQTMVLPNSLSGILTPMILDACRTAGETAPIMFTGAVFYKAVNEWGLFLYTPKEQCMALSYHLFTVSTQVRGVPEAMPFATAVVLLGTVLFFNSSAIILRTYMRFRKKW